MAATIIIVLILAAVAVISIVGYSKKLKSGCCGAGGDSGVKIKVTDKDPKNYPYTATISVDGMTCKHCKERVENSLNALSGVWAEVDLKNNSATVRMKEKLEEFDLRRAVIAAGYGVNGVEW